MNELNELNETDKAYLAGIVDGEGCIGIYVQKAGDGYSAHMLSVTVGMTDPEAVQMIADAYGAAAHWQKGSTANSKPRLRVVLRSDRAARCLRDMLPYLRVKRRQAIVGLDFQQSRTNLVRTNGKGWSVGRVRMTEEEWNLRESYRVRMAELNSGQLGVTPIYRAVAETEWRGAVRRAHSEATVRTSREREEGSGNDYPAPIEEW